MVMGGGTAVAPSIGALLLLLSVPNASAAGHPGRHERTRPLDRIPVHHRRPGPAAPRILDATPRPRHRVGSSPNYRTANPQPTPFGRPFAAVISLTFSLGLFLTTTLLLRPFPACLAAAALAQGDAQPEEDEWFVTPVPEEEEVPEETVVWSTVLECTNVVYERNNIDVLMLSWRNGTKDWLGFTNPTMALEYGKEYFRGQVLATLCTGPHRRVLILGLGLGAMPTTIRGIDGSTVIDVIEIDEEVIAGTSRLLPLPWDERLVIHCADAAEFVRRPDRRGRYDFVMFDCSDSQGIPSVFHSTDFFEAAIGCLTPRGVFSATLLHDSPEVDPIREFLGRRLTSPKVLFCKTTAQCIVFGAASEEGAHLLTDKELMMAATDLDASALLLYNLEPLAERLQPLAAWDPPPPFAP